MGYACPVCDAPQRDETHLANHLALQAIVHGDDHETWLDEHAPDWDSMNPDSLGPVVSDFAEEHEFDEVFEDTVDRTQRHKHGHGHEHGIGHEHGHGQTPQFGGRDGSEPLSGDAARIFEEARSLTEEMQDDEGGTNDDESGANGDESGANGDEGGANGDEVGTEDADQRNSDDDADEKES
ncbi:hypothetical protein E6P09_01475 [Haloferax mediterranei ATCC 33500]|uniref:Uncharacterized protein n=1 Tax=Haloferax mediterranei (strain ATCC 33500 / DSM 1411 / JCM 8866 / NBRC 14739 / NCIMB 2177 / R-4) TaxID=523841 RepID=I3R677_HALMT|nr:DUF5810 domain-containing protein [Haloferax mediterranei]AFK19737.1 hypothetical protein HFX_2045 [Haloferax mediterranei ATCC 33500]AHZ23123.1 hypothetical protein BM92_10965 [Haloferax mediterranei ATCC 33500]EMA00058.1 hypothetical protein C439_11998 [Haloferax mediterranei ATCC 33500]MDX5987519.1 DUF5810 domain-containing protein [Haloferax mediterranei ATCC 33500]QCQ74017.1 hypothetical protein E6P09_01475 [Haloferax mediterranei ATCC 33500]